MQLQTASTCKLRPFDASVTPNTPNDRLNDANRWARAGWVLHRWQPARRAVAGRTVSTIHPLSQNPTCPLSLPCRMEPPATSQGRFMWTYCGFRLGRFVISQHDWYMRRCLASNPVKPDLTKLTQ